jgi:hypothetical protein
MINNLTAYFLSTKNENNAATFMVGCQLTLFSKPVSLLHIINTGATEKGGASDTGLFFENDRSSPYLEGNFFHEKICINYEKKCIGLQFGPFISKLIWSPWL